MADTSFDVIIIGSGPGGYVTAIRAAQLGFKTAIVEAAYLGGICLNWGCIPTKALLRSAEIYHYMQHAKDYGLSAEKVGYDAKAVVQRSRGVSKRLNDGVGFLMKKNKVQVIWGEATIDAPGKVTVKKSAVEGPKGALGEGAYQAKHIIIATGARPRVLPGLEPDKKLIWTYFEAMVPEKMPKSLLVVGSGAIGIEFASFFHTMGSEVTVVEVLPQILPVEDAEIAGLARKRFEKQGIKILHLDQSDKTGEESRQRGRDHRRRQEPANHRVRARDFRSRRGRQYRESRAWKSSASKPIAASSSSTAYARPMCPASTPSAMSQVRRCWRTRPSMRA